MHSVIYAHSNTSDGFVMNISTEHARISQHVSCHASVLIFFCSQILGVWQRAVLQRVSSLVSTQALRDPVAELETKIALNQIVYPDGGLVYHVSSQVLASLCDRACYMT